MILSAGWFLGEKKLRAQKSLMALTALAALFALVAGCKHQQSDGDAIRAGITQHLTGLKTLNLSAMDMEVNDVTIEDRHARAHVTFRPKSGAPQGAGMQITYQLEKRDSDWVVVKTEAVGGMIEHPATNANPHVQSGSMHESLPNFREMIPSTTPPSTEELPKGHPAIDSSAQTKPIS